MTAYAIFERRGSRPYEFQDQDSGTQTTAIFDTRAAAEHIAAILGENYIIRAIDRPI